MKSIRNAIVVAAALGFFAVQVTGCDKIGQTPSGGSDAEVKAAFDKLPLDQRAKEMMRSPAPWDQKVQKIKDMYAKEGKTPPAELIGGEGGAPGSGHG